MAGTTATDEGARFNVDAPRYAPGISQGSREYFQERCKLAGEKVFKPLTKERGIEVLKQRKDVDSRDQWSREDPFGDDASGVGYLYTFIYWRNGHGGLTDTSPARAGFDFVDFVDAVGRRARYEARYAASPPGTPYPESLPFKPALTLDPAVRAKYGVTFEDISTVEDRKRWVAGGTMRLVELATGEVVAERTGFMMDPVNGAGVTNGRQPWLFARKLACPAFPTNPVNRQPDAYGMTRNWLESLLLK